MTESQAAELIESLELTRLEMAALTDALSRVSNALKDSTRETQRLCSILEARKPSGFGWFGRKP